MEILLIVAIVAVGVSGLYVAATFNRRTRRTTAPLMNEAVRGISRQVADTGGSLSQQLHEIDAQLQEERELIDQDIVRTQERLDHADMRISSIAGQLSAELNTIKQQYAQIGMWQDHFGGTLEQLDHQVAQIGESLARLSAQVAGIESHLESRETQTTANRGRIEGSIRDTGLRSPKLPWVNRYGRGSRDRHEAMDTLSRPSRPPRPAVSFPAGSWPILGRLNLQEKASPGDGPAHLCCQRASH